MNQSEWPKESMLEWIKERYEGKVVADSRSEAGNWLEYTLDKIEKGTAQISLTVKKEMTNPYGNIHGGMMSLLIDEVVGLAVVSMNADIHYTSLSLNVEFLYAIKQGDRLKAISQVVRQGKKIVFVECHVYDMSDVLLAKASSHLIATGMKIKD
jgi:acyl-coenzyme A thioesterase 13